MGRIDDGTDGIRNDRLAGGVEAASRHADGAATAADRGGQSCGRGLDTVSGTEGPCATEPVVVVAAPNRKAEGGGESTVRGGARERYDNNARRVDPDRL